MAKLKVALAALAVTYNGRKTELQPNQVFDASKANLDGIPDSYLRDPSEQESALWTMQNAQRERTIAGGQRAPVSQVKEPAEPNGPGGATEQADEADGGSSVAADADTVGATDQAKNSSTGTSGAAGGTETGDKTSSEGGSKKASSAKKRKADEDLA